MHLEVIGLTKFFGGLVAIHDIDTPIERKRSIGAIGILEAG